MGDATTFAGGFLGKLIINIIALGVLWFAVMAALKGSEITKEAAAPIASFGEEIGKLAKKLPQYAPIIPTKHGAASVSSLPNIATTVRSSIEGQAANRGQDIGQSIARAMGVQ